MSDEARWHLDKRVPIALISTLLVQTILLILFLAGLRFDLTSTMERLSRLEVEARSDRVSIADNKVNAAITATSLQDIKQALVRIENEVIQGRRDRDTLLQEVGK